MEHDGWYHFQAPSSAALSQPHLRNAAEARVPLPVHYQAPPFSAEDTYAAYAPPVNPNDVPSWGTAPAPVSSHPYEAPPGGILHPPGVDSYAPNPYAPQYAGYDGYALGYYGYPVAEQAPGYHALTGVDAGAFSARDAIRQYGADPVSYGSNLGGHPDFSPHQKKAIRPNYGSAWKKAKKTGKGLQSAYCRVCKVDCNSEEVLISHRQGKKHKKNLEKLKEAVMPKPVNAPKADKDKAINGQTEGNSIHATGAEKHKLEGGQKKKNGASVAETDLETKKKKLLEEGTKADAIRVCTICNIVCNSEVVFNFHIAGQKHATMVKQAACANDIANLGGYPDSSTPQKVAMQPHFRSARTKKTKKPVKVMQPAYCEVCKVDCSSEEVLVSHTRGKKHKENMEKLKEAMVPKPAEAPAAAAAENNGSSRAEDVKTQNRQTGDILDAAIVTEKDKATSSKKKKKPAFVVEVDLETKKRKLLEEGTKEDSMRVCDICNIVCNSELVFKSHVAGQKHAAMVKMQAGSAD